MTDEPDGEDLTTAINDAVDDAADEDTEFVTVATRRLFANELR